MKIERARYLVERGADGSRRFYDGCVGFNDSPPEHSKLGPDSLDRHRRLVRDELRRQTQHPIAETREPLVAPRIRQAAFSVTRAINFNDQPKFLRDEVRYVAPGDGYLTPE